VFLQEQRVVEIDITRLRGEVVFLAFQVQVVDPLVSVSNFVEQTEAKCFIDALFNFFLCIFTYETFLFDQCVYKLEFCKVVVSVDCVFGGSLDLDPD